jgi:hypothetical protein
MYGLARTQAELAAIKRLLGKKNEAEQLADQAKLGYQKLGNSQGISQIEDRMQTAEKLASSDLKKQSERECAQKIRIPGS